LYARLTTAFIERCRADDVLRKREDALARSSQAFRDLVNNSPDAIARLDMEGRYVFANRRMAEYGHCSSEDFIGKMLGSVTSGDSRPWIELVKRVVATGMGRNSSTLPALETSRLTFDSFPRSFPTDPFVPC
jgi:PAS domain-containing protein